ncbi:MAG: hypothetical protein U1C73_21890, partial [Dietzia sp.]|nr:hypothetical protein [Dietzia sp.]
AATKTLTLSGTATIAQYEAAIQAVTFTTTEGGLPRSLTISVTDETNKASLVPGVAVVTVIGLPPVITTVGTPVFTLGGSPVQVVSIVEVLDADSDELNSATITIVTGGQAGDVLDYTAPSNNPVTGTWDAATKTLTLSGTATIAQYEAAIQAVTFTTTEGGLPRGLTISVTDETNKASLAPGAAIVTVIGLPPVITTVGAPIFTLGGSPVQGVSVVEVLDADSDELNSATITIVTGGQDGDVLDYTPPNGNPVTGSWDAATKTLTLTGTATIAQYEEAIKAVTFATTEGGLPRSLTISVTDETNKASLAPGAAIVTVIGLPPLITTVGTPVHTINTAPVTLISDAVIADADSDYMSGATVQITLLAQSGDTLGYTALSGVPITASWDDDSKTLTLSGTATKAQYEQALEAVTFSATGGVLIVRTLSITVIDDTNKAALLPATILAGARYSLAPTVTTIGSPTYILGKEPTQLIAVADIADADSDYMSGATVQITLLAQSGDTLGYTALSGVPITASWDDGSKTLTLSGTATTAQYEQALEAVTFSATGGVLLVRTVSITVTDDALVSSVLPGTVTAGVANPVGPLLSASAPLFTTYSAGDPAVNPIGSATILDADSASMVEATITISEKYYAGDVLGYQAIDGNPVQASWNESTRTLTLSGTATKAQYEEALEAVTFFASQPGTTLLLPGATRTLTIVVKDDSGLTSTALVGRSVLA